MQQCRSVVKISEDKMNTIEKSTAAKHLGYLDGLRALAEIFVVLHHALLQVDFNQQPLTGFMKRFVGVFYHGHYAVDLFIVLSGFCLMLPITRGNGTLRNGAVNFFKRRAWRILPPYYFAMALSLLLIWFFIHEKTATHWDIRIPVTVESILTHLILMQDAFGDDFNINHAFWSISVEWRIYFLFPLLALSWQRIGAITTTTFAVLTSFVISKLCGHTIGSSLSAHYIGLFTLGMLGAAIALSS
jgi:peptidoglycan/LPS O-acetylase OafA/YrhL